MPRSDGKSKRSGRRPRTARPKRNRERSNKRDFARRGSENLDDQELSARQVSESEKLLSGIGVPTPSVFTPDPFQLEALAAIESEDVLVTAPTGSGKTWIAREEIRRLLASGKRTWYATPLKALTNSKYAEFSAEFGDDKVGILTGDRSENAGAPLIVGTTEIYRNQIFDTLREGGQLDTDFLILDEAHYLADDERGHVWEEAIILSPARIRILLLSATVGRAEAFARWIADVRGSKVRVINRSGTRPVELRAAFLSSSLRLIPLFSEDNRLNADVSKASPTRFHQ